MAPIEEIRRKNTLDGRIDKLASESQRRKIVGKVADMIEQSGIDLDDVGRIEKIRLNTYQAMTKDAEGEAHIHDLEAASVLLSPTWAEGPQWPVVQQAAPTKVNPPPPSRKKRNKHHTAVILPDPQIGFRRYENGDLDPFHDDQAMTAALKVVRDVDPDQVVNLGDFLDMAAWGKYTKEPSYYFTTQAAIDRGHLFLAEQRAAAPTAQIDVLEGNHDYRLPKGIIENATEAFGLKQANTLSHWPVLSIPFLLRMEELDVAYHAGYPAGELWITDEVRCIHGIKIRSNGSTASAVVNDEQVSTIFGHVHRLELQHKTRHTRHGPNRLYAATPGCLCRVDGAVPSVKGGTDLLGRPLTSWENWQQGLAIVSWYEDGPHTIELVQIEDGKAFFRGELIR